MTQNYRVARPMRVQARKGSQAEERYYRNASLPGGAWPMPKAIAPGVSPMPLEDLIFHGGKTVPQMQYQNIYGGSSADWQESDISAIERGIASAMRDRRLNDVIGQYFPGTQLSCEPLEHLLLDEDKPLFLDEPDVQALMVRLFRAGELNATDPSTTIFNLVLPRGTELALGESTSLLGLGGYHGSVHLRSSTGRITTLYYSANVFSEGDNGIPVFDRPWKNVVGTLYHELNEFRTDADVSDAIQTGDNDFLGWMSRRGHECGDEPIAVATSLEQVFKELMAGAGSERIPVQFMYSNRAHGPEGPSED
jgi:hypothetical protein